MSNLLAGPHSRYMGFYINKYEADRASAWQWVATKQGRYIPVELCADTLAELKAKVRDYCELENMTR